MCLMRGPARIRRACPASASGSACASLAHHLPMSSSVSPPKPVTAVCRPARLSGAFIRFQSRTCRKCADPDILQASGVDRSGEGDFLRVFRDRNFRRILRSEVGSRRRGNALQAKGSSLSIGKKSHNFTGRNKYFFIFMACDWPFHFVHFSQHVSEVENQEYELRKLQVARHGNFRKILSGRSSDAAKATDLWLHGCGTDGYAVHAAPVLADILSALRRMEYTDAGGRFRNVRPMHAPWRSRLRMTVLLTGRT